ncbi:hypothetical protein G3I59_37490 [Amycolatopsis rubida]|uniref:NIF system FeS cluster assembly NifU C-terminal domain-containing protein n=1 Tax=Amycolatopsis rubida TaxID=112413 RepID=A0ABX0C6T5_9PSEU|nr:NifU family protein [Amycolatopsis sp. M39]MYW96151.1 hypothetical protein [Amycolatopsis rubida]NEC61142.1 hypothetical protein [Amycolatopsis rubida]OAP23334.1 NifU-like domain protein [Amycolatopsis sp. M39]
MIETVEEAVANLRSMLQLDGADLSVVEADETSAVFAIELEGANCADCVLPASMIQSILEQQLSETLPRISKVVVRDPRETDASTAT